MLDFHFLSSTSALASHYSASVSSFPFFTVLPHSGLTVAQLSFRLIGFPFLSSMISHTFLPGSSTQFPVCFLSFFLDSLPQLFIKCLPFALRFRHIPFIFHFLSSASYQGLTTQLFVSSVPCFLFSLHTSYFSASILPFGFIDFHFFFHLVSHASVPVSSTQLSVSFLSSFPVSLPQPFNWCFPISMFFRPFLFRISAYFRFLSSTSICI